ncbi:MAG TPA: hypothetical protein VK778_05540 [Solirubrobacteraceae bacterium]|nr:hypothetical protein [Solirubrobacteraceae bacterium]
MTFLIVILTLVLLGLVALVVGAPLRSARRARDVEPQEGARSQPGGEPASPSAYTRDELEVAREAKYREIRDAELDYRTGKLSREDYEAIDADLRAEALEILNRLEGVTPTEP